MDSIKRALDPVDIKQKEQNFVGALLGYVIDNKDPEELNRVRVICPWIDPENYIPNENDGWIPVVTPFSLNEKSGGLIYPIEIGTQVVLIPLLGDLKKLVVIGFLFSRKDRPPEEYTNKKDIFGFVTRDGVKIIQDNSIEGQGKEVKYYPSGLVEKTDEQGNKIILNKNKNNYLKINKDGNIIIESNKSSIHLDEDFVSISTKEGEISIDKGKIDLKFANQPLMQITKDGIFTVNKIDKIKEKKDSVKQKISDVVFKINTSSRSLESIVNEILQKRFFRIEEVYSYIEAILSDLERLSRIDTTINEDIEFLEKQEAKVFGERALSNLFLIEQFKIENFALSSKNYSLKDIIKESVEKQFFIPQRLNNLTFNRLSETPLLSRRDFNFLGERFFLSKDSEVEKIINEALQDVFRFPSGNNNMISLVKEIITSNLSNWIASELKLDNLLPFSIVEQTLAKDKVSQILLELILKRDKKIDANFLIEFLKNSNFIREFPYQDYIGIINNLINKRKIDIDDIISLVKDQKFINDIAGSIKSPTIDIKEKIEAIEKLDEKILKEIDSFIKSNISIKIPENLLDSLGLSRLLRGFGERIRRMTRFIREPLQKIEAIIQTIEKEEEKLEEKKTEIGNYIKETIREIKRYSVDVRRIKESSENLLKATKIIWRINNIDKPGEILEALKELESLGFRIEKEDLIGKPYNEFLLVLDSKITKILRQVAQKIKEQILPYIEKQDLKTFNEKLNRFYNLIPEIPSNSNSLTEEQQEIKSSGVESPGIKIKKESIEFFGKKGETHFGPKIVLNEKETLMFAPGGELGLGTLISQDKDKIKLQGIGNTKNISTKFEINTKNVFIGAAGAEKGIGSNINLDIDKVEINSAMGEKKIGSNITLEPERIMILGPGNKQEAGSQIRIEPDNIKICAPGGNQQKGSNIFCDTKNIRINAGSTNPTDEGSFIHMIGNNIFIENKQGGKIRIIGNLVFIN